MSSLYDTVDFSSDDYDRVGIQRPISQGNQNQQKPVVTKDICARIKQHRFSILAFVCGVILTIAIVFPVMLTKSSPQEDGSTYTFTSRFDRKSTHSLVFLSKDNTVLSNVYTRETPDAVNHPEQLQSYLGALGNRCFKSTDKIYFEIKYTFTILSTMQDNDTTTLIAEIGLVSRNKVDNYFYVGGSDGWSFNIHNCLRSICLSAEHQIQKIDKLIKIINNRNTARTHVTGRLGFFVNMNRKEFSVIDKETINILHTFQRVSSPEEICPAFAVYNPSVVEVKVEMTYSYDFQKIPVFNVIA